MRFAADSSDARFLIQSYSKAHITINDTAYHHSLIISLDNILSSWPVTAAAQLQKAHFQEMITLAPELILLGVGESYTLVAPTLLYALQEQQIGVEVMSTPAACRTYNVLAAEGRRVVAALILQNPAT